MRGYASSSAARGWGTGLLVLSVVLSACASRDRSDGSRPLTIGERKQRMLMVTEASIHRLMGAAIEDVEQIHEEFEASVEALATPPRLNIVHPLRDEYRYDARADFKQAVKEAEEHAVAQLEEVLARYEELFWRVAIEAGQLERGSSLGYRTGYRELDEKVQAALAQLEGRVDINGIRQMGTFRAADEVVLNRKIRHEVEGVGVLNLLISAPEVQTRLVPGPTPTTPDGFYRLQESVVEVAAVTWEREAPEVPLQFVQAARYRVERGGIVVLETPWTLDPSTPEGSGIVPLEAGLEDAQALATEAAYPQVDCEQPTFPALHDHTLVAEYRTALQRADTGELLAIMGWQIAWGVDRRGKTRILVEESSERILEDATELRALLSDTSPERAEEDDRLGATTPRVLLAARR